VDFTSNNVDFTSNNVKITIHNVNFTLHNVNFTTNNVDFTIDLVNFTFHRHAKASWAAAAHLGALLRPPSRPLPIVAIRSPGGAPGYVVPRAFARDSNAPATPDEALTRTAKTTRAKARLTA